MSSQIYDLPNKEFFALYNMYGMAEKCYQLHGDTVFICDVLDFNCSKC